MCIDKRAALVGPCEEGTNRYFYQGTCKESNEFEHTYCASEEMTELVKVKGEVEVLPGAILALLHGSGHMIRIMDVQIESCINGTVLLGKSKAAVDDHDPSQGEIGIGASILKFSCND